MEPGNLSIGEAGAGGGPAVVDVDVESLADGVRVQGRVAFVWNGACRRCLGSATGDATSEILELFVDDPHAYEGYESSEGPSGAVDSVFEIRELTDGFIDLSDSVRDAILLGMPLAPLCHEDCEGPAPGQFPVEVVDDSGDGSAAGPVDDRWSALDALEFSRDDFDPGAT